MKRFYKEVSASASPSSQGGYVVLLDGKAVRTPKRAMLGLPNLALAEAIAEEWRGQGDTIDPQTMPLTRLAFAAIDVVTPERARVADQTLKYAQTDLLSYRAEDPPELAARQAHTWDPLLDWAAETYGARLNVGSGITHAAQPAEAIAELEQAVARYVSASEAFAAATVDETFQAEKWGRDAEAEKRSRHLLAELTAAEGFMRLLE